MTSPRGAAATAPDNEVMWGYLDGNLRNDYQLQPAEVDSAVKGYLAARAYPVPEYGKPFGFDLQAAAAQAYEGWASGADPSIVAVRESAQRVAAIEREIAYSNRDPGNRAVVAREAAVSTGPGSTLYNTAYLDGAVAALAELAAEEHPDGIDGFDSVSPRPVQPGAAALDMEAAEAAIGLLRQDRDRRGYTEQDAATARALRGVLDAAEAWDTVAAAEPAPLEDELRPDRVRSRGWDGDVVVDAGFAGVTITVHRAETVSGGVEYNFLASGPGGRGPLRDVDTTEIGMIAAGDRSPHPTRALVYQEVGGQVRHHLSGLADAVAQRQTLLQQQETRRAAATQPMVSASPPARRERAL